jgi:hypothetical protein
MSPRLLTLALAALAGITGCFREITDTVRVRDPHQVRAARDDGTALLSAGAEPAEAPVAEGTYWRWFSRVPYRVLLQRGPAGELTLHCEGCDQPPGSRTLLDASGALTPVTWGFIFLPPSPLVLDTAGVDLRIDTCLRRSGKSCAVRADTRLATPWSNVVDIHRTRTPSRTFGAFLLAWGAVPVASGIALAALGPPDLRVRAAGSAGLLAVGVAALSAGIWHLAAPAIEERPDAARPAAP